MQERQCLLSEPEILQLKAAALQEEGLAQCLSAVAVADCSPVLLHPGDEAMVQACWDRRVPDEDFLAESC